MPDKRYTPQLKSIIKILIIALIYYFTARFSLSFIFQPVGIAAIWPPTGIFLCAILLTRSKVRPYLAGILYLTDLVTEIMAGTPFFVSIFYSLALAGDALFSAWLLERFVRRPFAMIGRRDALGYLGLSIIISNGLMSFIAAAASTAIAGASFWDSWFWWAASAGVGNLLITPFILSWSGYSRIDWVNRKPNQVAEGIIILSLLALLNLIAFHYLSENNQFGLLLILLNFPLLMWLAVRLNLRIVTLALVLVSGIALWSEYNRTNTGFLIYEIQFSDVLTLQLYLAVMAIPALILATEEVERKRSEEAMRNSEMDFRSLFEDSPISLWEEDFSEIKVYLDHLRSRGVKDFETFFNTHPEELVKCIEKAKILRINWATVKLFGANTKEELLTSLIKLSTEDTLASNKQSILTIAQGKTTFGMEVKNWTLTGGIVDIQLSWMIPAGYEGTYQKAFVSMVDITDRKKMEKNLLESEERFRQLAENIKDVFWVTIHNTDNIEYVSPAYERIWGNKPEELYKDVSNWLDAIHPEDKNRVIQAFYDRRESCIYDIEYRIIKSDQSLHWIHDRGFPVVDGEGQVQRWVGVANDITEQKLAEEALRQRNVFIEAILENAPIGFAVNRISDGQGTFVSSQFDAIYGVPRGGMNTVDEYFENVYLDPIFREQIRQRMLTDMASGEAARMRWENIPITTRTGENRTVTAINIPLIEQDLMISTVQDVTERWRAEEEIKQYNTKLDQIRAILSGLTTQLNLHSILNRALQGALDLIEIESGILFLMDLKRQLISTMVELNVIQPVFAELPQPITSEISTLWKSFEKNGQPVICFEIAANTNEPAIPTFFPPEVKFFAAFPLQTKDQFLGILCVYTTSEKKPIQQNLNLLNNLCSPISLAIENAQLYERTHREAMRAESLARTAARLIAQIDFDAVIKIICEESARALDAPFSALFLYDSKQKAYGLRANFGFPDAYLQQHQKILKAVVDQLELKSAAEGRVLEFWDIHHFFEANTYTDIDIHTVITAFIQQGSNRIGILCVFLRGEKSQYTKEDLDLTQGLADQAGQAIVRARLFDQVSESQKHMQRLSQKLLEVQESERRTLALELHDELGQLLNSAKMSLDLIPSLPQPAAKDHLRRAQSLISDLVIRVRQMSLQLRPSMLDDMGLIPALRWLFKNYQLQTDEVVNFNHTNIEQRFPPQVEITAYRIIQEGLTNIIRHAGNKQVRVEIWADETSLNIQIIDSGDGFNPQEVLGKYESSGLSGMRERARLLEGELVIESAPGKGTTLSVTLPISTKGGDNNHENNDLTSR